MVDSLYQDGPRGIQGRVGTVVVRVKELSRAETASFHISPIPPKLGKGNVHFFTKQCVKVKRMLVKGGVLSTL